MTSESFFVFDTSSIISALLIKQSVPRQALDHALELGTLLLSTDVIQELEDVLSRKKFDKYITEEQRLEFLAKLVEEAAIIEVTISVTDCRDPKDNKFLELAISGQAKSIISSDADLLVLHPYQNIPILMPRQFLEEKTED